MDDVIAFSSPGDIVSVAEGIDLKRADVRREKSKVLGGRGEHMPRVEVEK